MASIAHRALVVQVNGIVYVSDGADEKYFDSVAEFVAAAPGFEMPDGAVGLNYEVRGGRVFHIRIASGGVVERQPSAAVPEYESIIDSVASL